MQEIEHLVLKLKPGFVSGFTYLTKYHADLGDDLQKALDVLEKEGWEASLSTGAVVILKRKPR